MEDVYIAEQDSSSYICHIESFSDELKNEIKSNLSSICHGAKKAHSSSKLYSYEKTLKEFWKRYKNKSNNIKKGMIGELLSHIIILKEFKNFQPASPYFNMEERSIKKGFDMILFDCGKNNIWITEVKSGEVGELTANVKNKALLNTAKNDLKNRLNKPGSTVWLNAINGAALSLKRGKVKDKINEILESITEKVQSGKPTSMDKDVLLISVLFNDLDDIILIDSVDEKRQDIVHENLFRSLLVFSIQKQTFQKVAAFLKKEAYK